MTWFTHARSAIEFTPTSLSWRGDELVDWPAGGNVWSLDGRMASAHRGWGYSRLDAAVTDRSGHWAIVLELTGTAGILLHDGEIVREIHRSPYHADAYHYPACLFERAGRMLLAHCPDSYARIEIEDARTGERLTRSDARKEADFFHSRLAVSPDGTRLLSAGWVWHPWDAVVWFDIAAALADPTHLDGLDSTSTSRHIGLAEESSAAWLDEDRVLLGGSEGVEDSEEAADAPALRLRPSGVAEFSISRDAYTRSAELSYPPGVLLPVGTDHVITFFEHPRLVSLVSGRVVHDWDIPSGHLVSSITRDTRHPALALDHANARFAIASDQQLHVVTVDAATLPH